MRCDSCKHWQPVYAPYIQKNVFSCVYKDQNKLKFQGRCEYWEKRTDNYMKELQKMMHGGKGQ